MNFFPLLYLVPKNFSSWITGIIAGLKLPFNLQTYLINWFIKAYNINTEEILMPLASYKTLRDFFIRELKPEARPIADDEFVYPADGSVTVKGRFDAAQSCLNQIKGRDYSLQELITSAWKASDFAQGKYMVIYLAPYNYHRIHSPSDCQIKKVVHIPGSLWPVNDWSVKNIDGLFICNERIIIELECRSGTMLMILVGATNVGKICLNFTDEIRGNQPGRRKLAAWKPKHEIYLGKGDLLGWFAMGSTVILIGDKLNSEGWDKRPLSDDKNSEISGIRVKFGERMEY